MSSSTEIIMGANSVWSPSGKGGDASWPEHLKRSEQPPTLTPPKQPFRKHPRSPRTSNTTLDKENLPPRFRQMKQQDSERQRNKQVAPFTYAVTHHPQPVLTRPMVQMQTPYLMNQIGHPRQIMSHPSYYQPPFARMSSNIPTQPQQFYVPPTHFGPMPPPRPFTFCLPFAAIAPPQPPPPARHPPYTNTAYEQLAKSIEAAANQLALYKRDRCTFENAAVDRGCLDLHEESQPKLFEPSFAVEQMRSGGTAKEAMNAAIASAMRQWTATKIILDRLRKRDWQIPGHIMAAFDEWTGSIRIVDQLVNCGGNTSDSSIRFINEFDRTIRWTQAIDSLVRVTLIARTAIAMLLEVILTQVPPPVCAAEEQFDQEVPDEDAGEAMKQFWKALKQESRPISE